MHWSTPDAAPRRWLLPVALVLALCAVACSDEALIEVTLVSQGEDPFRDVVAIRLQASADGMETRTGLAPLSKGSVRLAPIPIGTKNVTIRVEGLNRNQEPISEGEAQIPEVTADLPDKPVEIIFTRCTTVGYMDKDGDNHGNPLLKRQGCIQPGGFVEAGDDCNDSDPKANPEQTDYFEVPIEGTLDDFDYNCRDGEEKKWEEVANCVWDPPNKCNGGWEGSAPDCGQQGTWLECDKKCEPLPGEPRTQACR
jgi:hypothetical protein